MKSWAPLLALTFSACVPTPEYYSVPPQHKPITGGGPPVLDSFVRAEDADADMFFVKDVKMLEGPNFRWTYAEPEIRFFLESVKNRSFRLDFTIHDVTFRDTGPVTIVVRVNGRELGKETYGKPGRYLFEQRVPPNWLRSREENRVAISVLNPWNAPDPGVKLGFLFHAAGFLE